MHVGEYTFTCRVEAPMALPARKASVLRGALGAALRRVACALKRESCETCLLRERCIYALFFEPLPPLPGSPRGATARPHPFVLRPPETEATGLAPGERLSFGLLLFGSANGALPYLVYAVLAAGERGLGRPVDGIRGRFALEAVHFAGAVIYDEAGGRLEEPGALEGLPPPDATPLSPGTSPSRIDCRCLTPLRLKAENRFQDTLPFDLLVRGALRRIASLEATYGAGEPALDYRGLVERAGTVRTVHADLRWEEWPRYSGRQKAEMRLGGMVGRCVYEGEGLGEFLPLLRYVERVHLGKQTTFGLGRVEVEPPCCAPTPGRRRYDRGR